MMYARFLASTAVAVLLSVTAATAQDDAADEAEAGERIITHSTRVIDDFELQAVLDRIEELGETAEPIGNGDVNADGIIHVSDPIYMLNFLFRDGPAPVSLPCAVTTPRGEEFEPLGNASIRLELDELAWEADVNIAVEHEEALTYLAIHDPDGGLVAEFRDEGGRPLGLKEFDLETADTSLEGAAESFPEGEYLFRAVTESGAQVARLATLSHDLLPAPLFDTRFEQDELVVEWPFQADADGYVVEIEQGDLDFQLRFELDGDVERFELPAAIFRPGMPYKFDIGSVSEDGNVTSVSASVEIPPSTTE